MKPFGIIYLTSRVENGEVVKRYVGQHKLRNGVIEDGYLGSGNLLRRAIKKYGKECFSREIMELCYSQEELNQAEQVWISLFDAVRRKDFYNLAKGGHDGSLANKRAVLCYDLKGNFVAEFPGVSEAAEFCKRSGPNICKACDGSRFSVGNYQWKYKDSDKVIGVKKVQKRTTRGLNQIDPNTGEVIRHFVSSTEAGRILGIPWPGSLAGAAANGYLCGGFLWQYEDVAINALELRNKIRTAKKKVIAYTKSGEFIKKFDSAKEAADYFGIRRRRVSAAACVTNRTMTGGGYKFCYEGEELK